MAYNSQFEGLNSIFLGTLNDASWNFGSFGNQLQNNLFQKTYPNGTVDAQDLFALNINRGRDHGLPTYVQFLKQKMGITVTSFDKLSLIKRSKIDLLKQLYA